MTDVQKEEIVAKLRSLLLPFTELMKMVRRFEGLESPEDIIRRYKRMASNIAALIDWPSDDLMERASGLALCPLCGLELFAHPTAENGLTLSCEGQLYHL